MKKSNNHYFVYILGDQSRSAVKIGMADDLQQQAQQAAASPKTKAGQQDQKLVYYEYYRLEEVAVARELQLRESTKDATFHLINSMNPNWLDLSDTLY